MHPLIFPHIQRQAIQLEFCYERFFDRQASIQTASIIQSKGSSTQQPIEIKKGDLSCNANPLFYKEIGM